MHALPIRCVILACLWIDAADAAAQTTDSAPVPAPAEQRDAEPFDGLWETTYGAMRLSRQGEQVSGVYWFAGVSHIRGRLVGEDRRRLQFEYDQPDGERGTGEFTISQDGGRFEGTWITEKGFGGRWTGKRVIPIPGRTWLIILESHWESGLRDPEYSFGSMLRSFFTRLPDVEVRHRFVHDLADLRRFCQDAAFLAEPVVLYISSHGTPDGPAIGSDIASVETIAECVRDIHNLQLLHFGACALMRGDAPERIAAAMPEGVRFPISGFTEYVDWAGSALVDFTYLEMIFERGLAPVDAVEATRDMLSFARGPDEVSLGQRIQRFLSGETPRIPPTGLAIFDPETGRH